jgi:hypothetical protein
MLVVKMMQNIRRFVTDTFVGIMYSEVGIEEYEEVSTLVGALGWESATDQLSWVGDEA